MADKQIFLDNVSAKFYLRNKKRERSTVDCIIYYDGKLYKYCTGLKVSVDDWSAKHQIAINGNKTNALTERNNNILNERIAQIRSVVESAKATYQNNPTIQLNTLIYNMLHTEQTEDDSQHNVIGLFNDLLDTEYKERSDVQETKRAIDLFEKFYTNNKTPLIECAKKSYFLRFKDFCVKECKGLSATTLNRRMGVIITFLNKLDDRGHIDGNNEIRGWSGYKVKNDTAKDNIPFLYNEEVIKLFNHKCEKPEDEKYKDMFLLECATGQRISDIKELGNHIQKIGERHVLDVITKKENKRVKCSIVFKMALDILEKYNYQLPHINADYVNKRLKVIAKECGLNRVWTTSKHLVGAQKTKVEKKELWEVITSHVGRHTFDSLLKMRGWSNEKISQYTGHNADMVTRYTMACTDVDVLHYEDVRAKNINDIVLTIEEWSERHNQPSANGIKKAL